MSTDQSPGEPKIKRWSSLSRQLSLKMQSTLEKSTTMQNIDGGSALLQETDDNYLRDIPEDATAEDLNQLMQDQENDDDYNKADDGGEGDTKVSKLMKIGLGTKIFHRTVSMQRIHKGSEFTDQDLMHWPFNLDSNQKFTDELEHIHQNETQVIKQNIQTNMANYMQTYMDHQAFPFHLDIDVKFECDVCKGHYGQLSFEIKKTKNDKYAIIVKGFDHEAKQLIALVHEYNSSTYECQFIKKIELSQPQLQVNCVSMLYCSMLMSGFKLLYFTTRQDEEFVYVQEMALNLEDLETDDDVINEWKIPRKNEENDLSEYNVLGVIINKNFRKVSQKTEQNPYLQEKVQDDLDYQIINIFYTHQESCEFAMIEFRSTKNFEKILHYKVAELDVTRTIFTFLAREGEYEESKDMIVFFYQTPNLERRYEVYDVNNIEGEEELEVKRNESVPLTEYAQELKNEDDFPLKKIIREIRLEIKIFDRYKFQWFQQIGTKAVDGKLEELQFKHKSQVIFLSINKIAQKFMDIGIHDISIQKLNVIQDMNKGQILIAIGNEKGDLELRLFDISKDKRMQVIDENKLSRMNFQLLQIFKHEQDNTRNLTFSSQYHNVLRGYYNVYCFNTKGLITVNDIYHTTNNYHHQFLFEISQDWYNQFQNINGKTFIADNKSQNMFVNIKDEYGNIKTQLILKYEGNDMKEYCLTWNPEFSVDRSDQQPILVTYDENIVQLRKKVKNPIQFQIETLRVQENGNQEQPIVVLKYHNDNQEILQSVWFCILDMNTFRITHSKLLDLNTNELPEIKSIKLCANKNQNHDDEKDMRDPLPVDCHHQTNYQMCVWFGDEIWTVKIYEFRVRTFNHAVNENQSFVQVDLVGQKFLIGSMMEGFNPSTYKMHILPLFDTQNKVKGTQVIFSMKESEAKEQCILNLPNLNKNNFQYRNKFTYFGFRKYNQGCVNAQQFILYEVKLNETIYEEQDYFTDYCKAQICKNALTAFINSVFMNFESFLYQGEEINTENYRFFQPLEILKGKSMCSYTITNPSEVINKINRRNYMKNIWSTQTGKEFEIYRTMLDLMCYKDEKKDFRRDFFHNSGTIHLINPDISTLLTPLHYCFQMKTVQLQSVHLFIKYMFDENVVSNYDQSLMMQTLYLCGQRDTYSSELNEFMCVTKDESYNELSFENFYDNDILPRGSNKKIQAFNFKVPFLTRNSIGRFIQDVILSKEDIIRGQKYSVDFAFFDFRSVNYIRKLEQFSKNYSEKKTEKVPPFNELHQQKMIRQICIQSGENLENFVGAHKLIDLVFEEAQYYFKSLFFIYIMGFLIPFLLMEFINRDIRYWMNIQTITITFFGIIEFMKLLKLNYRYFYDFWNVITFTLILQWYIYYYLKMGDGFAEVNVQTYTNKVVGMNLFRLLICAQAFLRVLNFMRTFEEFATLIMLLSEVLEDIKYFQIFYMLLVVALATMTKITQTNYSDNFEGSDIPPNVQLLIQTFENSIGNIQNPSYRQIDHAHVSYFLKKLQLTMIWLIWLFNQYFILVIMLNFLISVISDVYAEIMSHKTMYKYLYRNQLNVDYLEIKDIFMEPKHLEIMIVVTDKEAYQTQVDEMETVQNNIVENVSSQIKENVSQVQEEMGELKENVSNIQGEIVEIKQMLKELTSK